MKQMVSAIDMANLSPIAKQKISEWLKGKEYGSTFDGEFIGSTQLTIGQMIELLNDLDPEGYDIGIRKENICDLLFHQVKEILEQKN